MTLQSEKSHGEQTNTSSITEQEIIYNIILCYVAMGERQKCQKALDALLIHRAEPKFEKFKQEV
jgi:hypothetical protein